MLIYLVFCSICTIFAAEIIKCNSMEAKNSSLTTRRRISRTGMYARTHKWMIELASPELQAQCKSYKDGKKVANYETPA